jgi:hypothetical protein
LLHGQEHVAEQRQEVQGIAEVAPIDVIDRWVLFGWVEFLGTLVGGGEFFSQWASCCSAARTAASVMSLLCASRFQLGSSTSTFAAN